MDGGNLSNGEWEILGGIVLMGVRKLKMPVFDGDDAHGWVYRVERYFFVNRLTEEERLIAAGLCLEGRALALYQWREMRLSIRSWGEFKDCLIERFRTSREEDCYEQFFVLMQGGSVMEYRERFEYLASRLGRQTETTLEGNFMKGLKSDIRAAVQVLRPRGLADAMELAQLVEDQKHWERDGSVSITGPSYRTTTTFMTPRASTTPPQDILKEKTGGFRP